LIIEYLRNGFDPVQVIVSLLILALVMFFVAYLLERTSQRRNVEESDR
jgi:hypothetical protein